MLVFGQGCSFPLMMVIAKLSERNTAQEHNRSTNRQLVKMRHFNQIGKKLIYSV